MSRRKQPNPNKVKLMDSSAEEKKMGEEVSSAIATMEDEQMEETDKHAESPRKTAASVADAQIRVEAGKEGAVGADLSSITSMMSTVMKAAQLNGGVEVPNKTPTKTSSKSPSATRYARKSQDAKDDSGPLICPLCDKNCQTQHQLTMHIRQHNTDTGTADHSCSICGKCLSSASSLDRHMLVHSGERPYKCSVCNQTFTTNGNMHRHMKIHDKDPSLSSPTSPPASGKRKRPSAVISKKKPSQNEHGEQSNEPSNKRLLLKGGGVDDQTVSKGQEGQLPCPICFKTFSSKNDLETHMETHPDTALRCEHCCISFRTHRGLLRHNAAIHKKLPTDPSGRPFIQNNPSIPQGFNDLVFIDFSCHKFPHIAQVWCETNLRRSTSKLHCFVCETCDKAFPLSVALDLHKSTHDKSENKEKSSSSKPSSSEAPVSEKSSFMSSLGLQHISQVKPVPSEEDALQAKLDSIRVIHVEPSLVQNESSFLSGISLSLVDPSSLRGLSQNDALKLLSLQPFETGFLVQPDGGMVVKPVNGETGMELADIQQILKVASAAPNQISLPPLSKAPCSAVQSNYKQMPPLKPKPLVAPRTNMTTSTPPPLLSTQQASLGCISPSLPPPAGQFAKAAKEMSPSSSSSSTCNQASIEKMEMEADYMGDAHTPMDTDDQQIKQAEDKLREPPVKKGASRKGSYPCRFCDQVFAYSGVLQAHMRYHLGILPHQCNICDYVAPDKATLIRHLRTHSGERPYVCRVCHYPFTVKANCERHLRKKHMKNTRKEIEKNIKYVTSSTLMPDTLEQNGLGDTTCCLCGEDLKTSRALQIHMRVHNGFQRKPFECKCCGATFLAKRNCIHHLLKQHPEIKEQDIEQHIATITVASSRMTSKPSSANGMPPSALLCPIKVEDLSFYSADQDQPLDFSNKNRGSNNAGNISDSFRIKVESATYEDSMEPIDLSIPKKPIKKIKINTDAILQREVKKEQTYLNIMDHTSAPGVHIDRAIDEKPQQLGCYQLPTALTTVGPTRAAGSALRLKPLLPKPSNAGVKELPPLASIAQIISSVSGAPDLLKRDSPNGCSDSVSDASAEELHQEGSKRRSNKKQAIIKAREKPAMNSTDPSVDLESSGEFASVEKMLATSNANKFSTYLKTNIMELERKEEEEESCNGDKKEGNDEKDMQAKQTSPPLQSKGKKNAYSNSVQKMTCPFCPRVFPWASSLQRHMLTHTGQKPYPCPKCEALFSTKSNCERHLLRKHGVTNRNLRQNGSLPKSKDSEECSPESAESMSETELPSGEAMELTICGPEKPTASDAEKPSPAKPTEAAAVKTLLHQGEPEHQDVHESLKRRSTVNDDDTHSNKSLDLNFASKLIDFTFSEGEQQRSSPALESDSHEQEESKLTCKSCNKSFRYAATLARHEKVHIIESVVDTTSMDLKVDDTAESCELKEDDVENEVEKVERNGMAECEEAGSAMDSGSDEDREERSDEEGGPTEPKSGDGNAVLSRSKSDKRKKICGVCGKRFWSLQDLTRHMRSHTGERPYKCQTCERTFTLKHSLVRHQRIHQKPRGADGENGRAGDEDGFSGGSASERESTPTSTNPPSENESESVKEKVCESASITKRKTELNTASVTEKTQSTPAAKTPKEPPAEDLASDSPTGGEQPAGFLQGLLEIRSKPDIEHILPTSEPPLVGVE